MPSVASTLALGRGAIAALCLASSFGCDASVTSVGAWEPSGRSLYLEAESGDLSGGFSVLGDATASNGQYLEPPAGVTSADTPGVARSRYEFTAPADGDYVIWGRIWSPGVSSNRIWFQVDGGPWLLWRISTGTIWFWDDLHEDADYYRPLVFPFTAGPHQLQLANAVSGVRLDRLYLSAEGDEPPGNSTSCFPPHSIDLDGECHPSCGSHARGDLDTTCLRSVCEGLETVEAYDCDVCCLVPVQ